MIKIQTFSRSKFAKNVLTIISGTALAQIITFVSTPIITRIYGPEPIGLLGTFLAVISILGPVVALTYPIAIVLPKSDRKARSVVKLALAITLLVVIAMTLVLLLASEQVIELFGLEALSNFIYVLPFFILLTGISQVMEQWMIRTKQFKIIAKTAVLQSLFINGSKIGGGLFYPVSAVLVIIQTISIFLRAFLMFIMSDKTIINRVEKHSFNELKEVAIEKRDFPMYRAPQVFFNAISQGLPVLLLAKYFGPSVAGFYTVGKQALNTPVQLIGKAVQDVFYSKVNDLANDQKKITPVILKAVTGLFAVGIIPFGIIIIFGPWIFSFAFGSEWFTAGEYARWIGFVGFSMLITKPIIVSIPVLGIQKQFLIIEIVGTVGKVGAIISGLYFFNEAIYAVALFSLASVLMYIYLTFYTLIVSRRFDQIIN